MKLLVIDGNSIANRAFYGVRLLSTKNGEFTNALFGFLSILQKIIDKIEQVFYIIKRTSVLWKRRPIWTRMKN